MRHCHERNVANALQIMWKKNERKRWKSVLFMFSFVSKHNDKINICLPAIFNDVSQFIRTNFNQWNVISCVSWNFPSNYVEYATYQINNDMFWRMFSTVHDYIPLTHDTDMQEVNHIPICASINFRKWHLIKKDFHRSYHFIISQFEASPLLPLQNIYGIFRNYETELLA